MVKLGSQVMQNQRGLPTRTERRIFENQQAAIQAQRDAELRDAQTRLSEAEDLNQYESIYNSLSSSQRAAFKSPSQIRLELQAEREVTIQNIDDKIAQAREKQNEQNALLQSSTRTASQERSADAKIQFYEGQIKGLQEARDRISGGENISFDQALDYANQLGESREARRRDKLIRGDQPKIQAPKRVGTFTGLVREFKIGEGGQEEITGAKLFVQGRQVGYDEFAKKASVPEIERKLTEAATIRQNELFRQEIEKAYAEATPETIVKVSDAGAQELDVVPRMNVVPKEFLPKNDFVSKILDFKGDRTFVYNRPEAKAREGNDKFSVKPGDVPVVREGFEVMEGFREEAQKKADEAFEKRKAEIREKEYNSFGAKLQRFFKKYNPEPPKAVGKGFSKFFNYVRETDQQEFGRDLSNAVSNTLVKGTDKLLDIFDFSAPLAKPAVTGLATQKVTVTETPAEIRDFNYGRDFPESLKRDKEIYKIEEERVNKVYEPFFEAKKKYNFAQTDVNLVEGASPVRKASAAILRRFAEARYKKEIKKAYEQNIDFFRGRPKATTFVENYFLEGEQIGLAEKDTGISRASLGSLPGQKGSIISGSPFGAPKRSREGAIAINPFKTGTIETIPAQELPGVNVRDFIGREPQVTRTLTQEGQMIAGARGGAEVGGRRPFFRPKPFLFPSQEALARDPSKINRFLEGTGDVLSGLFLKSTVGLGTRGFASGEPTALSREELIERKESALDKITIFGYTRGELFRGQPAPKDRFTGAFLPFGQGINIIPAQIEGIKISKDIRESGRAAVAQRETDISTIQTGVTQLEEVNTQIKNLNQQVQAGQVAPELAQRSFTELEEKRKGVLLGLASKGIKSEFETDPEGQQTIRFTSKALETDLAPAGVKLLRGADRAERSKLIFGGLATEAAEFGSIGLLTGGTGVSAKVGLGISKLPTIAKVPLIAGLGGYSLFSIGKGGVQGIQSGEAAGLSKAEGFALGAAIPTTQLTAFGLGSYAGGQFYSDRTIAKLQRGGFTKPIQVETQTAQGTVKAPGQAREGATLFRGDQSFTKVKQADLLRTKIPGTDIKIDTTGKIEGIFSGEKGRSLGLSVSEISGKQAGIYQGQKLTTRAFYFDQSGKTGVVTFTKTPKGVLVNQFRTGTVPLKSKILAQTPEGQQTVFIDFNRYVERIGDPFLVKSASLSTKDLKSIVSARIDVNRLFTPFVGEDKIYTLGRTQQIIEISPKKPVISEFGIGGSSFKVVSESDATQTFRSIGSSRVARTDALKDILNAITKQEGSSKFLKGLISSRRGQLAIPSFGQTETVTTTTPSVKIPGFGGFQDTRLTSISPIFSQLEPGVRSALAQNALLGSLGLAGLGRLVSPTPKSILSQKVQQFQIQNLGLEQVQGLTPTQIQQQQQQQIQQQQQLQIQQLIQSPILTTPTITTGFPTTPTPFSPILIPPFAGFGDLGGVRKRLRKRKSGKELFYVQDFVSKVLDLPALEVTEAQAAKLLSKTQTGFEIRRPIVIKNNKMLNKLLRQ